MRDCEKVRLDFFVRLRVFASMRYLMAFELWKLKTYNEKDIIIIEHKDPEISEDLEQGMYRV